MVKFGENSANFGQIWAILRNFGEKQQKIQRFFTKILRLESRRLGRAWVALLRVYFFVDWTCNLGRIDYRAYLGDGFPRPRIRRDTAENVDLAGFFGGTPRRTRPTDSDNSDASPDSDASDD